MNETYLNHFLRAYPNLQEITMRGNELIYNQESFQIQCLNVEEYLKGNMYIAASLKVLCQVVLVNPKLVINELMKEEEILPFNM